MNKLVENEKVLLAMNESFKIQNSQQKLESDSLKIENGALKQSLKVICFLYFICNMYKYDAILRYTHNA